MASPTKVTVGVVPPQLSLRPVTDPMLEAGTCSAQETVWPAGQVRLGGVWSLTVMVCEQVVELVQASVVRYVRVTVKRLAQVWLLMASPTKVTVGVAPPQLSPSPVTKLILEPGTCSAQETVWPAGQVRLGGVWSLTVIICEQVAELVQTSVAL